MKMVKIATIVPDVFLPNAQTIYIYNRRLLDNITPSNTTGRPSNKEYNVRVYSYPDLAAQGYGRYGVIAFYGVNYGNLKMDWKGSYSARWAAVGTADEIVRMKWAKGYREHPLHQVNARIPGQFIQDIIAEQKQKVQPAEKTPEPEKAPTPQKEEKYEIPPEFADLVGSKKIKLLRVAQTPEHWGHSDYDSVGDLLERINMVAVDIGAAVIAYKIHQVGNREERWVLVTQDMERKNSYDMLTDLSQLDPNQMNVVGTYDSKAAARQGAIRDIIAREDLAARQNRPEQPEVKQPVDQPFQDASIPKNPEKTDVEVDPIYDGLIGNSKRNWYKKSQKEYLTQEERDEVKNLFGNNLECSFAKDKAGYYCHTHRARSKSYKKIKDIPKSDVEFIESTG